MLRSSAKPPSAGALVPRRSRRTPTRPKPTLLAEEHQRRGRLVLRHPHRLLTVGRRQSRAAPALLRNQFEDLPQEGFLVALGHVDLLKLPYLREQTLRFCGVQLGEVALIRQHILPRLQPTDLLHELDKEVSHTTVPRRS